MRRRAAAAAAALVVVVGGLVAPADGAQPGVRPTVVVAVADSGINPYHQDFYRPRNTAHPCTWVAGFTDCTVPALRLSLGRGLTYREALLHDREVWASVQPGRWYWIPRTNIIGAVCQSAGVLAAPGTSSDAACVLDEDGHGTGTASSVVSEAPDALLLVHEGTAAATELATAPVRADVQSHSWGAPVPLPDQAAAGLSGGCLHEMGRHEEAVYFQGAGNEAPFPAIADCRMQPEDVQVVGGGYPGYWTPASWSTYDFASWFCRPVARHDATSGTDTSCGTSFSAPTAAGAAAAALLRVRQDEGWAGRSTATHVSRTLTRERFVAALRDAASYAPTARYPSPCLDPDPACASFARYGSPWVPLPPDSPWVFWGYGWLDGTVVDAVVRCATGGVCPPKPAEAASWNQTRQDVRRQLGLQALAPAHDDAGSHRDAGDDGQSAVRVLPGVSYDGALVPGTDWRDAYVVRGRAGQHLTVTTSTTGVPAEQPVGCWTVLGPAGERLTPSSAANLTSCEPGSAPTRLRLPADGAFTVVYSSYLPHAYRFSLRLER